MTPNLIELIVQAVYKAIYTNPMTEETELSAKQLIRTALASIPEMPQVDLGEVEKLVQNEVDATAFSKEYMASGHYMTPDDRIKMAEMLRKKIGYSISDLPTTKGAQG